MRKLALKIEELHVESFSTEQHASAESGTVRGHVNDLDVGGTWWWSCEDGPTEGTCIGPTYCCPDTWRTCDGSSCVIWYCPPDY